VACPRIRFKYAWLQDTVNDYPMPYSVISCKQDMNHRKDADLNPSLSEKKKKHKTIMYIVRGTGLKQ
jgi:hypothetical protein